MGTFGLCGRCPDSQMDHAANVDRGRSALGDPFNQSLPEISRARL